MSNFLVLNYLNIFYFKWLVVHIISWLSSATHGYVWLQVGRYPRHVISLFFRLLYPWYWPSSCWNFVMTCVRTIYYYLLHLLVSMWDDFRRPRHQRAHREWGNGGRNTSRIRCCCCSLVSVSIVGRLVAASCVCYHETFFWVKVMCSFTLMERCEIERCAVREKGPRMRTSCIYILPQISVHEGLQR
jgi:hypothetical protein